MKLLLVFAAVISSTYAASPIMCNSMVGDKLTAAACAGDQVNATMCTSPVVIEYTGLSSQAYGCGDCSAADKGTCVACNGTADAACNTAVEVKTFHCFSYTFNATAKKWAVSAAAGNCSSKPDTALKCNKPGLSANGTYDFPNAGCGPCDESALNANLCLECGKDKCNSATTLSFFLAPLIAALFSLM